MRHFVTRLFLSFILLVAMLGVGQAQQYICSFDTLADEQPFFAEMTQKAQIQGDVNQTGWSVSYSHIDNNGFMVFIGDGRTPVVSRKTQSEFLLVMDKEIQGVQSEYNGSGIMSQRTVNFNVQPYGWNVIASPSYGGKTFYERVERLQMADECYFLMMVRYPLNHPEQSVFETEISKLRTYVSSLSKPVEFKIIVNRPSGVMALLWGIVVPSVIAFGSLSLIRGVPLFPHGNPTRFLVSIVGTTHIIGCLIAMISGILFVKGHDDFVGYELVILSAVSLVCMSAWLGLSKKRYDLSVPLALSSTMFLSLGSYTLMGWYLNITAFIIALISILISAVFCAVGGYYTEKDALFEMNGKKRIYQG